MDLFGRKRRQQERDNFEEIITELVARLNCVEGLTFHLLSTLPPGPRENALNEMRTFVVQLKELQPPSYIPAHRQQQFRDELSRVAQIFIENAKDAPATPINSN